MGNQDTWCLLYFIDNIKTSDMIEFNVNVQVLPKNVGLNFYIYHLKEETYSPYFEKSV